MMGFPCIAVCWPSHVSLAVFKAWPLRRLPQFPSHYATAPVSAVFTISTKRGSNVVGFAAEVGDVLKIRLVEIFKAETNRFSEPNWEKVSGG